jgi:hypothetical protein
MSDAKRCFMQWFVLSLAYVLAGFFAVWYGLPQTIWKTDVTYMTSVIAVITAATIGYIGLASWRLGGKRHMHMTPQAVADANLGRIAAYVVTLFGLLGTVIGLQHQVQAMASVTPDHIIQFLAEVAVALGTAMYATACGIIGSIAIIATVANLDYFIDYSDVDSQ